MPLILTKDGVRADSGASWLPFLRIQKIIKLRGQHAIV